MTIGAKAFGKILVFGAYSILEPGNMGLVVNINKGTTTKVDEVSSGQVVVDLSNFQISIDVFIDGHKVKMDKRQDFIKFIKSAVEYTYEYLSYKGVKLKDIKVSTSSDPEFFIKRKFKSGFGSSATATVSTVAAILSLHSIENKDLVFKISKFAHYIAQGSTGSGYDVAAACYGSHFFLSWPINTTNFVEYVESTPQHKGEWFAWPSYLQPIIVFTGKSASTQDLIMKVLKFKEKRSQEYKVFMKTYNDVNVKLMHAFSAGSKNEIRQLLEQSWEIRKELGRRAKADIEPNKFTKMITEFKINGAFTAGLVGAGGGDSILVLCDNEYDKKHLLSYLNRKGYHLFEDVKISDNPYTLL